MLEEGLLGHVKGRTLCERGGARRGRESRGGGMAGVVVEGRGEREARDCDVVGAKGSLGESTRKRVFKI